MLIASTKGLHVQRNGDQVFPPGGTAVGFRGRALSRSDMAVLAAVAVTLVPVLLLEGRALSLPSLLGRGIESLIPGLSDSTSRGRLGVTPRSSGAPVLTERPGRFGAGTVLPPIDLGAGHSTLRVGSGTTPAPISSRGSRAVAVKDPGVTGESPAAGASPPTGASSSTGGSSVPGTAGPGDGTGDAGTGNPGTGNPGTGNPGPPDTGGPGVSGGVNGTTATVSAGVGPATATATSSAGANGATTTVSAGTQSTRVSGAATISGSAPGVSAGVAVADATTGAGVGVAIPPGEISVPAAAATVASVAGALPAAETAVATVATGLALPGA